MAKTVRKGLLAGAVGTTLIEAVTYGDMLVRGRDASTLPDRTVGALLARVGVKVPGDKRRRANRLSALGALSGTAAGLGIGLVGAGARDVGVRLPFPVEAVVLGVGAMAATDLPVALLGVEDPRTWTTAAWVQDAVPHLAFGATVAGTYRAFERNQEPRAAASTGLVLRSALLGVASGGRSSLGAAAPVLTSSSTGSRAKAAALLGMVGEMTADKLPATPSRLQPQGLASRVVAASGGATALAGRERANAAVPLAVAAAGAVAGSFAGAAWRRWAAARVPDWQGALVEDAASAVLALLAARRR